MANKGSKSNKLKRKRGKKFRFFDEKDATSSKGVANPFEEHSVTKKFIKDKSKRTELITEF
jgi:nucleolar protein 14